MANHNVTLEEIRVGAGLLWNLPFFLRRPVSLEEARTVFRHRMENRAKDFLFAVKRGVFDNPASPYRALLEHAGCEYGDLAGLVKRDGVEGALRALFHQGVYLTLEEFKGREPAIRGSLEIRISPSQLHNPSSASHAMTWTSGSRGTRVMVPVDLDVVRDRAIDKCLMLHIPRVKHWRHAIWLVPGGNSISQLLQYTLLSSSPVVWFSQLDPFAPELHPRYRWSDRVLRWAGRLARVPFSEPLYVPLDDPIEIARWMENVLAGGETPLLHTFPSSAVRLCRAAQEAGTDLTGACFTLLGEMTTSVRLSVIRRTGARAWPVFGSRESGVIGQGCFNPEVADELHLLEDLNAVIQPETAAATRLSANALLISSIRPTSPYTLLNVSVGDLATVTQRRCGCGLEDLGLFTHLHTIRSQEKLTAGGMTFLDTDVFSALEEVLPSRFGGGPTDYQLLEEDDQNGNPHIRLLVHPSVGPVDADEIVRTFLECIGAGSGAERVMGLVWRQGNFVEVERRPPLTTATGKIQHVHVSQRH